MGDDLNYSIVLNLTNQGGGHAILQEINSEWAEGGKRYNICTPRDIILDGKLLFSQDGKKLSEVYHILTEPGCRVILPPGDWSEWRTIVLYLTPGMDETSEGFKRTILYKMMKPLHDENLTLRVANRSLIERAMEIEDLVREAISLGLSDLSMKKLSQSIEIIKGMVKEEPSQIPQEPKKSVPK
jgi:hypothetical protein